VAAPIGADLILLTPVGALVALAAVVPLVALVFSRGRARRARVPLGLADPPTRSLVVPVASVLLAAAFLGAAAAQPVVERSKRLEERTDAEVFVVLDTTRSMLARSGAGSETRLERAKAAARELRAAIPGVPVGLASLTDRVLPHVFPTTDGDVFDATLDRSMGIERPPPRSSFATNATKLDALATVRTLRYFAPSAHKRVLVVLTDGESQPIAASRLRALFGQAPAIETVFVQIWSSDERVFTEGEPEPYRPDPSAYVLLGGLATSVDGSAYRERDLSAAREKTRELLGSGPTVTRGEYAGRVPLAPYLAAATLAPLALLLRRRDR
jgi:hypothetical protein